MARSVNLRKREAEVNFPHKVDIAIPRFGLGSRLGKMLQWCRQNVAAGNWAQHHHIEHRGDVPSDHARFYFMNVSDADAFGGRWCDTAQASDD
jgi:hypothetical protein